GRAALALAAGDQSLQLSWESVPDKAPASPTQSAKGDTLAAFRTLPPDTLIAFGGNDAPGLLAGVDDALNKFAADQLGDSGPTLQVHFTKWLAGEFAGGFGRGTLKLRAQDSQGADGCPA